jgi:outer membrane receptor for ferrienterochelin and colicin
MRGEFGPLNADAEVYTHSFGLYASLTPFKDLGVTLGYAGIYTKYLDEFLGSTRVIETLVPYVLKSGLSLNARYQGIPNLTLRTDHNYSFWADMDYRIFEIPQVGNMGLISSASAAAYADVTHLVLWNGLGATYNFNEHCSLEIYLRNLYRDDRAEDFVLTRNQFVVEPKLTWKIDDRFSMWAGVSWELLVDTVSEELNKRGAKSNVFVSGNAPIETRDTTQVIKVPLGVNLKL